MTEHAQPPAVIHRIPRSIIAGIPIEIEKDSVYRDKKNNIEYGYASADKLFKECRKAFNEMHVDLECSEEEFEIVMTKTRSGTKPYLRIAYRLRIRDGELPLEEQEPYERLTMFVPYRNPQSIQAARTMAVKYYLRSRFLISTGEPDHDNSQYDTSDVFEGEAEEVEQNDDPPKKKLSQSERIRQKAEQSKKKAEPPAEATATEKEGDLV